MTASRPRLAALVGLLVLAACGSGGGGDGSSGDGPSNPPPPSSSSSPPAPAPPSAPALPAGVYELSGVDPTAPTTDLEPLRGIVEGVEIAGLGETIHTSGGYSAARARVMRFFVEQLGYRAISFEGPWGAAEATRRYVEDGEGTLRDAMVGLTFLAWSNDVTAAFLEWLRAFDAAHPNDKVRFFGFDIQGPEHDGAFVRSFFARAAPTQQALADGTRSCLGAKHDTVADEMTDPDEAPYLKIQAELPPERHQACVDALAALDAYVTANVASLTAATSAADVELTRIAVLSLRANDGEYFDFSRDPVKSYEARDDGMAETLLRMRALRAPAAKTVIWAHNRHVMRKGDALVPAPNDIAWHSMGSSLADALGEKYAPIGLFAHRVEYNWDGTKVTTDPPRDGDDDLERPLAALGKPYLLVDLAHNGVFAPGAKFEMGSFGGTGVPAEHYRALIFLEHSPAQKAYSF